MAVPQKPLPCFFLWLLAGVLGVALAWSLDNPVDAALDVSQKPVLHWFAVCYSKLGESWVPALAGISLTIFFLLRHRPNAAAKVFFVVLTCEITGLAGLLVRLLTGRTRPSSHMPQGFYGVWHDGHWIIGKFEFSAFPSGHAAMAVGLAAAVWLIHRGWGTVATLFALAVAWSRVALQSHHFSDVMAAAVLAIPLAVILKKALWPSVEFQFANLYRIGHFAPRPPVGIHGASLNNH
ncbi:MAG TPA: phosphatase PAP2 family protein [Candidatus Acidoferrum sp.]|nr:phosphatase PAP2 family protein [Candidatus Acidoferrum sp.]